MATATAAQGYRTSYTVKARDRSGEFEGDMEGTTHAATGLILGAGVGLLTSVPHAHGAAVAGNVGHDFLYAFLVAGAALLPDADHPKATFAHTAGAVSHGLAHLVAVLFGGHRQGMHSFAGIGAMIFTVLALGTWWPNRWCLGILAAVLAMVIAGGLASTGFARHGLEALAVGCALAGIAVVFVRPDLWWLVALGMALHVAEDMFTGHGCALLWPLSRRRIGGDGRQPAARRTSPGTARRPQSGYQRARARATRPAGPSRPPARTAGPSKPMCPTCLVGNCPECRDRGCGCPERGPGIHELRPKRRPAASVEPTVPDFPVPEDDIPPF
jgi:membrane-bound metal-dependent hydrolase YbcI (DUF457 family)